MKPISPAIDPLTQRSAIEALESQRAAYRRFAHEAAAQQTSLGNGDLDQVAAFTDTAITDMDALDRGARNVGKMMDEARRAGMPTTELAELERRMDAMMREARDAETAIRNLTTQLEAWRDAFGKQLADLGVNVGGGGGGAADATSEHSVAPVRGYGARQVTRAPRLLDRKG